MLITTIIFSWNESRMLPYQLRNAFKYSDRVVLLDNGSTDDTTRIAERHNVTVMDYGAQTGNKVSDLHLTRLKNSVYQGLPGDWFFIHDMDEFPYCSGDMRQLLACYDQQCVTLPVTTGYCMYPPSALNPDDHLPDVVKLGYADGHYSKRVAVHRTCKVNYLPGAHGCHPANGIPSKSCDIYVLHYKWLFGYQYVLQRAIETRDRMSALNIRNGWGKQYMSPERDVECAWRMLEANKRLVL